MDDYDISGLPDEVWVFDLHRTYTVDRFVGLWQPFVVFVASTTGDGDVPDNMVTFWRFLLRATLPGDVLSAVRFACFGLGDSRFVISPSITLDWWVAT
jgi:sulfite reductase alpha subunit-like flavoprotein